MSGEADDHVQGSAIQLRDIEPWPKLVNGNDVLDAIAKTFSRYIVLPDGAADVLALWCASTHVYDLFDCTPRLSISSPDKRCGKTTLRDVISLFVSRPLLAENLTVAVLFRLIESHRPTILADECDSWLRDDGLLRGLLNSGYRRGGKAYRCQGDGFAVRAFEVFAPVVLCGIGTLPATLHDRSIEIRLKRAKPLEMRDRFNSRRTQTEQELCQKLIRFCVDNRAELENCDPTMPPSAIHRIADKWRPLFAFAEVVGGEWPERASVAFAKLTFDDADTDSVGIMLLADIRQVFTEAKAERIFSRELVDKLCGMSDRPWPEAHSGKGITEVWLARHLRNFGINSKTMRIKKRDGEDRAKGYELADFSDPFERYLSESEASTRDNVTSQQISPSEDFLIRDNHDASHGSNFHESSINVDLSRCHASEPSKTVAVPFMITRQMEADLRALGYSQHEIDTLRPEEARRVLSTISAAKDKW